MDVEYFTHALSAEEIKNMYLEKLNPDQRNVVEGVQVYVCVRARSVLERESDFDSLLSLTKFKTLTRKFIKPQEKGEKGYVFEMFDVGLEKNR